MIYFWCSLPGWYSLCMELSNDTSTDSCLELVSKTLYIISTSIVKKLKMLGILVFIFFFMYC